MEFKGTKGPWRIDHWTGNDGGLKCLEIDKNGINRFSGGLVTEDYYQITADLKPREHNLSGDFRGPHVCKVSDFSSLDGGIETIANVRLIASSPELLQGLKESNEMIEKLLSVSGGRSWGKQILKDQWQKNDDLIKKALGINEVKAEI